MTANKEWFEDWFNSRYYHLLYNNRDEQEAQEFINKLLAFLKPPADSYVLDLACGKGRHAIQLAEKGYNVIGIDLSEKSILEAKKHEKENLQFFVHDMRNLLYTNYFDFTFNFFTSFGYFERESDSFKTLNALNKSLKKDGILVIDFLNVKLAIRDMLPFEQIEREDIAFNIEKKVENGFIVKDIKFEVQTRAFHFQEKVQALELPQFKEILTKSNFTIQHIFGNYALDAFDEESSERLILIAKKNV